MNTVPEQAESVNYPTQNKYRDHVDKNKKWKHNSSDSDARWKNSKHVFMYCGSNTRKSQIPGIWGYMQILWGGKNDFAKACRQSKPVNLPEQETCSDHNDDEEADTLHMTDVNSVQR